MRIPRWHEIVALFRDDYDEEEYEIRPRHPGEYPSDIDLLEAAGKAVEGWSKYDATVSIDWKEGSPRIEQWDVPFG